MIDSSHNQIAAIVIGIGALIFASERIINFITKSLRERVDSLEKRIASVESSDKASVEMLQKVYDRIEHMRAESTQQHADMRNYVHSEIRRLEEKWGARSSDIYAKITELGRSK